MYRLKYSGKIKKDLKICQKRGYDLQLLEMVLDKRMIPEPLDTRNKDHSLQGDYKGFRECHITPEETFLY